MHKCVYIYMYYFQLYIYTWNPNDPSFDWERPSFGGLKLQNRGQTWTNRFQVYVYTNLGRHTQADGFHGWTLYNEAGRGC